MNRKLTAALLITAAVLTNVAFFALGSVFDYPDVLQKPSGEILAAFTASQRAVVGWFVVLALSAALFAPIAVGVGKLARNRAMRIAVPVGMAAAVVQVVGLSRWPLLVPGYASAGDVSAFETAHRLLGTLIGETLGYALTAAWILLVLAALGRSLAGLWFVALGGVAAVLVLTGVVSPLGVPGVDFTNFLGYVLFSVWLVVFAVVLLTRPGTRTSADASPGEPAVGNASSRR
ncbi:DUF4386 family protein [Actinoplanes sp. TBRC 11911]|uniref:DUF4386 family protein n=1 Tax=Actinoplanes sp. TBRC 11911 TaxID=2729386 RepID=UPI00145C9167|nr:DUF4386 family protein [Actinoplanes sp. TBRC 11911]NMO49608.1 DUF4386 family protein [Actinoplanes sp. TBRC 11911]